MPENKLTEIQRDIEKTLAKMKATEDVKERRMLIREMGRLLAKADSALDPNEPLSPAALISNYLSISTSLDSLETAASRTAAPKSGYVFNKTDIHPRKA